MAKRPQTTWRRMFSIVNAQGTPWTSKAFWNADEARVYLKQCAKEMPELKLNRHRIVRVSMTIRVTAEK